MLFIVVNADISDERIWSKIQANNGKSIREPIPASFGVMCRTLCYQLISGLIHKEEHPFILTMTNMSSNGTRKNQRSNKYGEGIFIFAGQQIQVFYPEMFAAKTAEVKL